MEIALSCYSASMEIRSAKFNHSSDFLHKSVMGVAIMGVVIVTPFTINNFVQGRYILGIGSLAIIIILAFNAWGISQDRYYPRVILLVLIPVILVFLIMAIQKLGVIGALWCYPAVIAIYFMLPEREAWIANLLFLVVILPVAWIDLEQPLAIRLCATLLGVSVFSAIFIRVITEQQCELQEMAVTDPLTGLFNRTLLPITLEQAIQHNQRRGESMTLIVLDVDRFKSINDSMGHDAGDQVLRNIGEFLDKRFRRLDRVFRVGGEEFMVLLHGTGWEDGFRITESLRREVMSHELLPDTQVTISAGMATYQSGEDLAVWMKRADENLYRAKTEGRNKVVA